MRIKYFENTFRAAAVLLLIACLLFCSACGNAGAAGDGTNTSESGGNGSTGDAESNGGESTSSAETDGSQEPPTGEDRFLDGTMIYYEDFDGYGDVSGNAEVLSVLRENGIWELDDKTDPYYEKSVSYAAKSTCLYAIEDGKLRIMGYRDEDGNAIEVPTDTYLVVADENLLWELNGRDYTIRYDVSYDSFKDVKRYICVLWNYYGQHYNSFHLRVNGTGNLQAHTAGTWLDLDYADGNDLYSGSLDTNGGTSIANKLLGIDLGGKNSNAVFTEMTVNVCIRVSSDGTVSVWLSSEGGEEVEVARYHASSEIGARLNQHVPFCNGGSLAIKTGGGINGTLDNLMVYIGHGDVPEDKTVTFVPKEAPEIPFTSSFTQESVVLNNEYRDLKYSSFNASADPEWIVPGLGQGFIPQGMDVWEEKDLLLISGYFKNTLYSSSSVLFAVDMKSGEFVGEYYLKNTDGTNHTSHAGGVAVTAKNVFIANGSTLYRIPLSDLEAAGRGGDVRIVETIVTPTRASFCNASDGYLWVGDFYIPNHETYKAPEGREVLKDDNGTEYGAWCVGYRLTDETENELSADAWENGMEYATPDVVLGITQKIQGFAVVGDHIVLSQSYGRANDSKLLRYENVLSDEGDSSVTLNGTSVPVHFLGAEDQVESCTALPMSEGLAAYDGALLILFESGASYYKDDGGKNPTDRVWRMLFG